jgi:hypothetical protein
LSAERVYHLPFDNAAALDRAWSSLSVREGRLIEAFGEDDKVKGFIAWIEANCEGRFYIAAWVRFFQNQAEGEVKIYFEHPPSAFTTKMKWV